MSESVKCAFVTGGSRGIGAGIIKRLAADGCDVAFTYNTAKDEADNVADVVKSYGKRCFFYQADLEKPESPESITKQAIEDLGKLDILVNNAGRFVPNRIMDLDFDLLEYLFGLNYRTTMLCSKVAAKHMVENNIAGNIVNIASTRGIRAYPNDAVYGGLKAAIIRSTESMALDLSKYSIRVNCVAPGATCIRGSYELEDLQKGLGPKIPAGRLGSPADIAGAVAFLVSEEATYITGQTIKVDGGLVLPGMPEDTSPEAGYGWGKK